MLSLFFYFYVNILEKKITLEQRQQVLQIERKAAMKFNNRNFFPKTRFNVEELVVVTLLDNGVSGIFPKLVLQRLLEMG